MFDISPQCEESADQLSQAKEVLSAHDYYLDRATRESLWEAQER
jgi:hypothetical protein